MWYGMFYNAGQPKGENGENFQIHHKDKKLIWESSGGYYPPKKSKFDTTFDFANL